MVRQTNLLPMALASSGSRARKSDTSDLAQALMVKQAFTPEPIHSVGHGLTKMGQMALMGWLEGKRDRDAKSERSKLADALFGSVGGESGGGKSASMGAKLGKALMGESLAPDTSFVDRTISVESGGDPTAKNPRSSATGPGQFIDSTWLDMVGRHRPELAEGRSRQELLALRTDPALSREMTEAYGNQNAQFLESRGLPVNDATKYLAHFAGPGGAADVLSSDPNTPVVRVLGEQVARANPFLQNMTVADLKGWAERKMGTPQSGGIRSADMSRNLEGRAGGDQLMSQSLTPQLAQQLRIEPAGGVSDADLRHNMAPVATQGYAPELPGNGAPGGFSGGYGAATGLDGRPQAPARNPAPPMPQQQNAAPAASQAPQQAPQPITMRANVGDPGEHVLRQQQMRAGAPWMQQQAQAPQMQPAMGQPPAPQPQTIAPGQQPQPLPQQAQQDVPEEQQPGWMERYLEPQEMQMLRTLFQSGEISGEQVLKYVEDKRAAMQPDYAYEKMPDGTLVQIDRRNGQVQPVYEGGPKPTGTMQEYEIAKQQGYQGSFFDYQRDLKQAGAQTINVGPHGEQLPDPEKGTVYARDAQGNTIFEPDENGYMRPVQIPVAGGSVERAQAEAARETAAADEQAHARFENAARSGNTIVFNAGRILNLMDQSGDWLTSGLPGKVGAGIPGTPGARVAGYMFDMTSNVMVEEIQQAREASPTGGLMGNMSERQSDSMRTLRGQLEAGMHPDDIRINTKRLANMSLDMMHGTPREIAQVVEQARSDPATLERLARRMGVAPDIEQVERRAAQLAQRYEIELDEFGNPTGRKTSNELQPSRFFDERGIGEQVDPLMSQSDQGGGAPPPGVDPEDWEYMTPEQRALWR